MRDDRSRHRDRGSYRTRRRSPSRERGRSSRRSRSTSEDRSRKRQRRSVHSRSHSRGSSRSRSSSGERRHKHSGSRSRSHSHERQTSSSKRDSKESKDIILAAGSAQAAADGNETEWSGPKASTTESNGEISCSVEETNRIRIALGLKPLSTGRGNRKENEAVENKRKADEEKEQERAQAEAQLKIEKARKKRLLNQKIEGKTLGEMFEEEEDMTSAAAWVARSRKIAAASKADEQKKKALQAKGYSSKNLAGMKVTHDASALESGESVILTLKDTSVLDETGNLAEEEDELENINIAEKERLQERKDRAIRASKPVYSGYDDEEFADPKAYAEGSKKLLSQYDDLPSKKKSFTLGQAGKAVAPKAESDDEDGKGSNTGKMKTNLNVDKMQAVKEYYTQEEFTKFVKPKKLRKKKLRKKADDDDDLDLAPLPATEELESRDHGNRAASKGTASGVEEAKSGGREAFERAREKSNAAAQALKTKAVAKAPAKANSTAEIVEDFAELEESLARARRVAQLRAKAEARLEEKNVSALAERIRQRALEDEQKGESTEKDEGKKIIFSQTTEFSRRLRAQMREQVEERKNKVSTEGIAMDVDEEAENESGWRSVAQTEDQNGDASGPSHADSTWGQDLPLVGNSMADTLKLLSATGDLRERGREQMSGRANDERVNFTRDDPSDKFKLEHRDEYGRLLTPKEAFRQLSYKFHGQKPGKKKQEKRLRQLVDEMSANKMFSADYVSKTMGALHKQQEKTGQAFIVLSGGNTGATINAFQEQLRKK